MNEKQMHDILVGIIRQLELARDNGNVVAVLLTQRRRIDKIIENYEEEFEIHD